MIRKVERKDVPGLKKVLDTIDLFPSSMLEAMIHDYLTNPDTAEIWFTMLEEEVPISIGYCAPEKLTEGTYNLYAIGVKYSEQGRGVGGAMMSYLETYLKKLDHRVLIVETSGTSEFALTRKFYKKRGYTEEAIIRDFWSEGDDKVIYWKKLK